MFPGRLTKWKGQIEFLNIVNALKDKKIIFYFIGDDKNISYKNKFINEINKKKLNNICRVLGNLNSEELKIMYKCSDIIISAPLKPEGFGRRVSAALAMKKIGLAYNFGGVKNQLEKLDSLYKVNPHDYPRDFDRTKNGTVRWKNRFSKVLDYIFESSKIAV